MELDSEHAADYELALRLQFEDLPPEFMQQPFLFHEVLHSFFPSHDQHHPEGDDFAEELDPLAHNSQPADCQNRICHTLHVHAAAMAPSSSSLVALPSSAHQPDLSLGPISFTGQPFKLFFKGLHATLDEELPSAVEAVIVAPAGQVVQQIACSLRPEISGRLVADYRALRNGLAAALELNISHVQAVGDSKVLEDQMNGALKIYSSTVRKLASEVIDQINQLEIFELVILPRMEHHSSAWDLANEFLKQSDKSADNSRGKMIATEPSTNLCSITLGEETSRVNSRKKMMEGCSSGFAHEDDFRQNSSSDKMTLMRVVEPSNDHRCNICLENKPDKEMLTVNGCLHAFCERCLMQQTESDIKGGRIPRCPEPACRREMQVEQCGQFLSTELFDLFTRLLAEASIPEHERLYCPYADCSELFLKTPSSSSSSPQKMIWNVATCVSCKRNFCLSCEVPSHAPLSCAEYQELPPEDKQEHDLRLFELAALSQWKRCGQCRMMIQRSEGCAHMTCRCGYEFCYNCQATWRTCRCS